MIPKSTKRRSKNINIAVLYAEADKSYWQELEKHINVLTKMHPNVHLWTRADITLGTEVSQEIRTELSRADITLLLLSVDFAFEKIFDDETRVLLDAYSKQQDDHRYIVPVIVKDFLWRDHYDAQFDIEKLKFFDKIAEYPHDRDKIYKEIAATLNRYIKEINAKVIHAMIPTWVGYLGGIMYNNGFIKSKATSLYKKYNRLLRFELSDNINEVCDAFLAGEVNLIWSTIDRLPATLHRLEDFNPKVIFQASWSDGADAIIARNSINTVEELRGKKVVFPYGTPAHTFLRHVLNEKGMEPFDLFNMPQNQPDLDEISRLFIEDESIDAVVLWSPYVEACLNEVPGAKVISHSGEYPNLIADVLVASEEYVKVNQAELLEFFTGWLDTIQLFLKNKDYQNTALDVLINAIVQPLPSIIPSKIKKDLVEALSSYFRQSLQKVHLCHHQDNLSFFGLKEGQASTGEKLYRHFLELQYPEFKDDLKLQWDNIVDTSILEKV